MKNIITVSILIAAVLLFYGCKGTKGTAQTTITTTQTVTVNTTAGQTTQPVTAESDVFVYEPGNTPGNISNGAIFCGYEGHIYYRSEKEWWALTKAMPDGTSRTKISDDIPSDISIVDGWIYYSNFSDGHRLYKIKTDGTQRTQLTECSVKSVNVIGDVIYFINWDNPDEAHVNLLTRINTDGTDMAVISDRPFSSVVTDGEYLFGQIAEGGGIFPIFKFDLDGNEIKKLNEGQYSHFISISGGYIFYWSVDENRLRRMNKDGADNIIISTAGVDYINSDDEYVYYLDAKDGYNIYKAGHDGDRPVRISSIKKDTSDLPSFMPSFIHVIDGYVFYRAYDSEDTGDMLFVIKPGDNTQEAWEK